MSKNKKRKLKRIRFFAIIGAITLMVVSAKGNEPQIIGYTTDNGNSLWEIAEKHCPEEMDIRKVIREIKSLNNMETSTVYSDMYYKVPIYEGK